MKTLILCIVSLTFGAASALAKAPAPTAGDGSVQIRIEGYDGKPVLIDGKKFALVANPVGGMTVAEAIAKASAEKGLGASFDKDQTRLVAIAGLNSKSTMPVQRVGTQNGYKGYGFYFLVDGKELESNVFEGKVRSSITIRYVQYYSRHDKGAELGNLVIKQAKSGKYIVVAPKVRFRHLR